MFFGNAMLEIAVVSLAMVTVSQLLQRKFVDRKAMKENQKKMKERQQKIKELMKKDDQKSKAEADRLQKEMLELMGSSMQGTMKHMIFSMPLFFVVFWLLSQAYAGIMIGLPIAVPVIHRNLAFEMTSNLSWLWWYIYSSAIFSIVWNIVMKVAKK